MKLDRSKNAANNLKWGILYRFSGILIPFVCKAAIIRIFGINYLGLNTLFASILTALNLAELGFGSAVVFFMYRAIAEEDNKKICALLKYYKHVYKIIGMVIFFAGLALMPFLKYLIKKDIPSDINIYIIYLITLVATVVSYLLFAYKNSILTAFQKESILYKIKSAVLLCESVLEIAAIFLFKNYYLYLSVSFAAAVANNILAAVYVKKYYPEYQPIGKLTSEDKNDITDKIKGLFLYKIGGVIVTSADSIVISAFLGLSAAGRYGNYYYVINLLYGLLAVYYTSFRAGLGNSLITESTETNYQTFRQLQFMQDWIIGWCAVCLICLYQDFIEIYAGKSNILDFGIAICLCAQFYFWKIQDVVHVYKEACGYWTKDRLRPLIGSLVNLILNVTLVQYIGLYGVVLSTVAVSVTIDVIWAPKSIFSEYFKKSRKEYYELLAISLADMLLMCGPTFLICSLISISSAIGRLVTKAFICILIPNIIFVILNYRKPEFKFLINKLNRMTQRMKGN